MSTPPAPTQELTQLQHHHQRPGRSRRSPASTAQTVPAGRLPLEALPVADLQRRYPTPTTGPAAHPTQQPAP